MAHSIHLPKLCNGISLVLIPLSNTEAVTTIVLMGVGSRFESDAQQGLAHFTEHMVFKGGRKYQTAQAVAQAMDAVGGEFNAFTSQEFTGFYTKTAAQHLELGFDVLSDIVLHATFPAEELEKEKGVIIEELNMYEDIPMRKVDQVMQQLAYGDSPLGRPIVGTKKSVAAFTREDFVNYRHQFYKGEQCTIAIAGAINVEKVTKLVEHYFAELPKGEPYKSEAAVLLRGKNRVALEEKASEQTHLIVGVEAYPLEHPRRYAYRLLSTILGGNMSSRLFISVREQQGLCYYVRATPDTYTDTGLLTISAGVDNFRLDQALTAIMQELTDLAKTEVDAPELERAKQFLLGKTLLGLEDSEQVAEFYGMQQLMEGKVEKLADMEKKLLAVTAEEVQAVAKELFQTERLRLAVIGPKHKRETLERLLEV